MSKEELKEYLKDNLKLDIRNNLSGNQHLCLILEDELINSIILPDD
jgi:hypothetical protein